MATTSGDHPPSNDCLIRSGRQIVSVGKSETISLPLACTDVTMSPFPGGERTPVLIAIQGSRDADTTLRQIDATMGYFLTRLQTRLLWIIIILDDNGECMIRHAFPNFLDIPNPHLGRHCGCCSHSFGMSPSFCVFEELTLACKTMFQSVFVEHTAQGVTSGSRLTSTRTGMKSQSGPC